VATLAERLDTNVAGDVYVDRTCIDCDTCRWMAPDTFERVREQSAVHRQPATPEELRRALMALVACPTASIGTTERHDLKPILAAFPDPIDGPVSHCGYHAEASFGATSYFIARPGGNVLVDSPRFAGPLVRRLEELGGVRHMILTHQDDVADHAKFAAHFGCTRVLHEADVTADTRDVERAVAGREPVALADDLLFIPTPGHTRGSACLLHADRYLFTGDHLAWSETRGHVYGFRDACWYDWGEVIASTRRLLPQRFEWILPGHGRRCHFPQEEMDAQMRRGLQWMESAR
jgi:glyoxylase-like metal-dependent hydrolase (beta-lactamase superfamily II)/ferredoxin